MRSSVIANIDVSVQSQIVSADDVANATFEGDKNVAPSVSSGICAGTWSVCSQTELVVLEGISVAGTVPSRLTKSCEAETSGRRASVPGQGTKR